MNGPRSAIVRERMRRAHTHARVELGLAPPPITEPVTDNRGDESWGWEGRSLGRPVSPDPASPPDLWLRVTVAGCAADPDMYWTGTQQAHEQIPAAVPRPALLRILDWTETECRYRAELYELSTSPPLSNSPVILSDPQLSLAWWESLRVALHVVSTVPTTRATTSTDYIERTVRRYTGADLRLGRLPWVTAHGDLHWANLCGPHLHILDWEGWGTAPLGYDLAILTAYSALSPSTQSRARDMLSVTLKSESLVASMEIAASAEILDAPALNSSRDALHCTHRKVLLDRVKRATPLAIR